MPERIVLVGLGGIGSQLLPSLVRYLAFRPEPRPMLVLVDGDAYEPGNRTRQVFPESAIGSNKAEALAEVYLDVIANAMRSRSWLRQRQPGA